MNWHKSSKAWSTTLPSHHESRYYKGVGRRCWILRRKRCPLCRRWSSSRGTRVQSPARARDSLYMVSIRVEVCRTHRLRYPLAHLPSLPFISPLRHPVRLRVRTQLSSSTPISINHPTHKDLRCHTNNRCLLPERESRGTYRTYLSRSNPIHEDHRN
jgi:hypothetical protein